MKISNKYIKIHSNILNWRYQVWESTVRIVESCYMVRYCIVILIDYLLYCTVLCTVLLNCFFELLRRIGVGPYIGHCVLSDHVINAIRRFMAIIKWVSPITVPQFSSVSETNLHRVYPCATLIKSFFFFFSS